MNDCLEIRAKASLKTATNQLGDLRISRYNMSQSYKLSNNLQLFALLFL